MSQRFYPIPYYKGLYIEAPRGAVFKFEQLKSVLPKEDWFKLSMEERANNIEAVASELSSALRMEIVRSYTGNFSGGDNE